MHGLATLRRLNDEFAARQRADREKREAAEDKAKASTSKDKE